MYENKKQFFRTLNINIIQKIHLKKQAILCIFLDYIKDTKRSRASTGGQNERTRNLLKAASGCIKNCKKSLIEQNRKIGRISI